MSARIINVARCSFHDGPGVRSVVYFKGCNLSCKWCHNPESQSALPEILYHESKCIHCGLCHVTCAACHAVENGTHVFDRALCTRCGKCAEACPTRALSLCGTEYDADALLQEIRADKDYFDESGGGVTFSGGECLLFPAFLREILTKCRQNGIHTAIETALDVPYSSIESVASLADLFLIDIKHMDSGMHKAYTGSGNERILDNIRRLAAAHPRLLFRVPLIPQVNDRWDNLKQTAEFALSVSDTARVELLKYNPLAENKYRALERTHCKYGEPQTNDRLGKLCKDLNDAVGKEVVYFTP